MDWYCINRVVDLEFVEQFVRADVNEPSDDSNHESSPHIDDIA
jgi:hypothetical protein